MCTWAVYTVEQLRSRYCTEDNQTKGAIFTEALNNPLPNRVAWNIRLKSVEGPVILVFFRGRVWVYASTAI